MKAIRINVHERTVSDVELGEDRLAAMQDIVDGPIEMAPGVPLEVDTLFVNEEGLFSSPKAFQMWEREDGQYMVFAGNGVIVGTNDDGETVDTCLSAESVKKKIQFADLSTVQFYSAIGRIAN